jgi:exodeoxyribonuclease V beta subunit
LDGRVAHILADEFQDTSQLQWEVLAPLAEEAMAGLGSEDRLGSFFCVGDQKQSLYRFRGAVPGFMNKIGLRYAERLKKEELDKNRRSDREIVEFVNKLFQNADKFIGGDETLSFSYTPQSAAKGSDGFVSYTVCADWECEGLVLDAVYELLSHNFAPKDIAVLTLTWSNANRIHAYLEDNGIPAAVLEEEKLSEKAAYVIIKGLVSYMHYADDFSLSSFLYAPPALGECSDIFFRRAKLIMNAQLAKSAGQTVYKRIIALKGRFNIISRFSDSMTELIVLMDIIARELSDIVSPLEFLERFEAKAADAAVSGKSPVDSYMNGKVGIGTVNQAKGLEYPAVILFKVNKEKTSLRDAYFTDRDSFSPFAAEIYMRRPKKSSEITFSPKYADALREENRFIRFDAVNKLYVAVTRARHALYLFAEHSKGETLDSYITEIFPGSFRRGAIPDMNTDNVGAPAAGNEREKNTLDRRINYFSKYILSKVKNPMELSNHPSLAKFIHERKAEETVERAEADMYAIKDYGLLFHGAVFYLKEFTPDSVAAAAAKAWEFYGGYLKTSERLRLENDLLLLLADERFYPLIKEKRIYREKALYYDGKLLITDLYAKGETEINLLDFKTSPPSTPREKGYLEQIELYKKALAAYYNLPVRGFLFYINDGKVTVKETENCSQVN